MNKKLWILCLFVPTAFVLAVTLFMLDRLDPTQSLKIVAANPAIIAGPPEDQLNSAELLVHNREPEPARATERKWICSASRSKHEPIAYATVQNGVILFSTVPLNQGWSPDEAASQVAPLNQLDRAGHQRFYPLQALYPDSSATVDASGQQLATPLSEL